MKQTKPGKEDFDPEPLQVDLGTYGLDAHIVCGAEWFFDFSDAFEAVHRSTREAALTR